MIRLILFLATFIIANVLLAQRDFVLTGSIVDAKTNLPLKNVKIYSRDETENPEYSNSNGTFTLKTKSNNYNLVCITEGYLPYRDRVTLNSEEPGVVRIHMTPNGVETVELTLTIKKDKSRVINTSLYFININGYDSFSSHYKHIINIPIKEIEENNNELKFSIEKIGYKILETNIIFNEYDKLKKSKSEELILIPKSDTTTELVKNNLGLKINSISLISGSLYSGTSWLIYKEKANDLFSNISPSLSQQKVNEWGDYMKYKTRFNLMGLTAINSILSSLPFIADWSNTYPNIDKRLLSGIFFIGSVTFLTSGIISGNKANDSNKQLNSTYSPLSDARVTKMGEYKMYKERKRLFYFNAAINLSTAINILFFYNRNKKKKAKKNVSILFNISSNNYYSSSFCFTVKKQF